MVANCDLCGGKNGGGGTASSVPSSIAGQVTDCFWWMMWIYIYKHSNIFWMLHGCFFVGKGVSDYYRDQTWIPYGLRVDRCTNIDAWLWNIYQTTKQFVVQQNKSRLEYQTNRVFRSSIVECSNWNYHTVSNTCFSKYDTLLAILAWCNRTVDQLI